MSDDKVRRCGYPLGGGFVCHRRVARTNLAKRCYIHSVRPESVSDWQPIETAPRDGTPILVWMPEKMLHSHIHSATFRPNSSFIGCHFAFDAPSQPTHWAHQPPPPSSVGDEP